MVCKNAKLNYIANRFGALLFGTPFLHAGFYIGKTLLNLWSISILHCVVHFQFSMFLFYPVVFQFPFQHFINSAPIQLRIGPGVGLVHIIDTSQLD